MVLWVMWYLRVHFLIKKLLERERERGWRDGTVVSTFVLWFWMAMTLVGFCWGMLVNDVRVTVGYILRAPYWFNKVRGITSVNQTMLKFQTHFYIKFNNKKKVCYIFSWKHLFPGYWTFIIKSIEMPLTLNQHRILLINLYVLFCK